MISFIQNFRKCKLTYSDKNVNHWFLTERDGGGEGLQKRVMEMFVVLIAIVSRMLFIRQNYSYTF